MKDSSSVPEPFPSAVVVNILVDEDKVSFFADGELKSSTIVFQLIKTVDKVPTGLTLLAPQIGMDIIL
jgi:hypothetical protein